MNILQRIGSIGESPNFIAWNAHMFFAAYTVSRFPKGLPRYIAAGVFGVVAFIKEFWFDLRYETSPPQKIKDSALDFAGHVSGIILGVLS